MTKGRAMDIYLVVWSGGYDSPEYRVFTDKQAAQDLAAQWAAASEEAPGQYVELLRITPEQQTVVRIAEMGSDAP